MSVKKDNPEDPTDSEVAKVIYGRVDLDQKSKDMCIQLYALKSALFQCLYTCSFFITQAILFDMCFLKEYAFGYYITNNYEIKVHHIASTIIFTYLFLLNLQIHPFQIHTSTHQILINFLQYLKNLVLD